MTGVGVYPSCASIIDSTPLAASTSRAVANAGSDKACVSMPRNSGPSMPAWRRYRQTACAIARICASLNAVAKAEPRCPDVPKTTRCDAIAGSGTSAKYAVTSRGILTSNDGGTGLPARGFMRSAMAPLSQNDLHAVRGAVVHQRDETVFVSRQHLVIE